MQKYNAITVITDKAMIVAGTNIQEPDEDTLRTFIQLQFRSPGFKATVDLGLDTAVAGDSGQVLFKFPRAVNLFVEGIDETKALILLLRLAADAMEEQLITLGVDCALPKPTEQEEGRVAVDFDYELFCEPLNDEPFRWKRPFGGSHRRHMQ